MKSKGFTLLETTIVLALAFLFLLLSFYFAPRSSAQFKEEQFMQNLTSKLDKAAMQGKEHHQIVRAFFGKEDVQILVGRKTEELEYPPTLIKYGAESVYISPSGVTRPTTIPLVSKKGHYSYNLIFELSFGGVYRVTKQEW